MTIKLKLIAFILLLISFASSARAEAQSQALAELNDGEIAHVVHTADAVNVRYAYLALALSDNAETRAFAHTIIHDREAVKQQRQALLEELGIEVKDNYVSYKITLNANMILDEMSALRGAEFDKRYAANELVFHQAVNGLVADSFVPNIENDGLIELFKESLKNTQTHAKHADAMVRKLKVTNLM